MAESNATASSKPEFPPDEPFVDARALPCPFCGGPATIMAWHGGTAERTSVQCEDDEGRSCPVGPDVLGETVAEALEHWNTRA